MMVMMTRLAATKLPTPQTPPPPLIIVAQRLWNLTITLSYYSFLAKPEKHWSKNHKLLSRLDNGCKTQTIHFTTQFSWIVLFSNRF